MTLKNRFVRSATGDNCAENGFVTEKQIRLFSDLAKGGVGLIITGMTAIHPSDQIRPLQNSLASDEFIPSYRRLVDTVHGHGAKIAVQLVHLGREKSKSLKEGDSPALAPSFVENDPYFSYGYYRSMTEEDIERVIMWFGDAAVRAREAGFDAVQLHGAHAYLLAQFLSPYTNHRDDEWGGSLENRLRIHREIYRTTRDRVGEDYPLLLKLGLADGFPEGLSIDEGIKAATLLALNGFDALEISQGLRGKWFKETEFRKNFHKPDREAYFRDWCRRLSRHVKTPLIMVGGLRYFGLMEEIVERGEADYVSMCRPFIREPDIVNMWKAGGHRPSACISCNRCFKALRNGEVTHCHHIKKGEGECLERRSNE